MFHGALLQKVENPVAHWAWITSELSYWLYTSLYAGRFV
jgi:hypothetical protein